jgi:hypothetical protein
MDRRNFFQLAAGSAAFAAFQDNAVERAKAASDYVSGRRPEEVAADEDYWAEIRDCFTVDRNVINLQQRLRQPFAARGAGRHAPLSRFQRDGPVAHADQ